MTLVSGNIRYMRILAWFPVGGGLKWEWGVWRRQFFGDLSGYFFGNFRDKASSIIRRYTTPCWLVIDCKMNDLEWSWMAIARQAVLDLEVSNYKHNYVKTDECRHILWAAKIYVNSSFLQHKSLPDTRRHFFLGCLQTWVRSLKSTTLLFFRCHIFVRFRNNVGIKCTLRQKTILDFCRHQ